MIFCRFKLLTALIICSKLISSTPKRNPIKSLTDSIVKTSINIQSIECVDKDPEFAHIEDCDIQSVNKSLRTFSLGIHLFQILSHHAMINLTMMRIESKKSSVLNEISTSFCEFVSNQRIPIFSPMFEYIKDYSNLNHSCPYDSEIIIKNLPINPGVIAILLPTGNYIAEFKLNIDQIPRLMIKVSTLVKKKF